MVKSMTGYGRAEAQQGKRSLVIEVRAVNNRYLDCGIKMPRAYTFAEDAMKGCVQKATTRGKVDVFVTVDRSAGDGTVVRVNEALAEQYMAALTSMADKFGLSRDIPVSLLSGFPDVLSVEKQEEDTDEVTEELCSVLSAALEDFNAMRAREGARLEEDILGKLITMETYVSRVEERSPQVLGEYRARLEKKMAEVLENTQIDEARILTEAALFADKIAVDEETVRLRSHISQFRGMLAAGGPVGRKLDFLVQEMNRETNTIGSKCNDLECSSIVVDMKAELEKIREQIQNLE